VVVHDVEQGSPEWLELRLGMPTSSEFHKIITPAGKVSSQREKYMARLIAEELLGESFESLDGLAWIEHGKLMEPKAAEAYEFENLCTTRKVGFVTSDNGLWGSSPDRLIDRNGVLEIKCPAPINHVYYDIMGFGGDYRVQVQGQMMICEAEHAVRYSWHKRMPSVTTKSPRDDRFIRDLREALELFSEQKARHLERLRSAGVYLKSKKPPSPVDSAYDGSLADWLITGGDELQNPMTAG
jgi:hypothetical protein